MYVCMCVMESACVYVCVMESACVCVCMCVYVCVYSGVRYFHCPLWKVLCKSAFSMTLHSVSFFLVLQNKKLCASLKRSGEGFNL
jgi:hypothetical protein